LRPEKGIQKRTTCTSSRFGISWEAGHSNVRNGYRKVLQAFCKEGEKDGHAGDPLVVGRGERYNNWKLLLTRQQKSTNTSTGARRELFGFEGGGKAHLESPVIPSRGPGRDSGVESPRKNLSTRATEESYSGLDVLGESGGDNKEAARGSVGHQEELKPTRGVIGECVGKSYGSPIETRKFRKSK